MEQNNELNQNQGSVENDTAMQTPDNSGSNVADQNLEVVSQNILNKEQPVKEAVAEPKSIQTYLDEINSLKKEIEAVKATLKSFSHHDLGTGKINAHCAPYKNKTLEENLEAYFNERR